MSVVEGVFYTVFKDRLLGKFGWVQKWWRLIVLVVVIFKFIQFLESWDF